MGSQKNLKSEWDDKTRKAVEHLIEDIKATLPPDASIVDIERALHKCAPAFLSSTFQALVEDQDFPPSEDKRES